MGSSKQSQPSAPQAPTYTSVMSDYVSNYPRLFELQQKYAPLEAQQAIDLAREYALPYGQAMMEAQEGLYPETSAIQEELSGIARRGYDEGMPDWQRQEYLSGLRANLGTNLGSPIGADYASRGMMQMNEDWKRYYQNLGLSMTGRQPLTQASTPQWTNQTGQANLGQALGFGQGMYNAQANMYGQQMNNYMQQQQMNSPWNYVQGAGNLMQGIGSIGMGGGMMGMKLPWAK